MKRLVLLLGVVVVGIAGQAVAVTGPGLQVTAIDAMRRVYPDRRVETTSEELIVHAPRGAPAPVGFVVSSAADGAVDVALADLTDTEGNVLPASVTVYQALSVHVEANNQGGSRTVVGGKVRESWQRFMPRMAPFDVAEVLVECSNLTLKAGQTHELVAVIDVPDRARPGRYTGAMIVRDGERKGQAPFVLEVHRTSVTGVAPPAAAHWMSVLSEDLVQGPAPPAWSEAHWRLLAEAGRQLRAFGDTVIYTELFSGKDALIAVTVHPDGSYTFGFDRFDRWVQTFVDVGYETIEGSCLGGGHWIFPYDVFATDRTTGETVKILSEDLTLRQQLKACEKDYKWPESRDQFAASAEYQDGRTQVVAFLDAFMPQLYAHLQERGWCDLYRQQLLDEPRLVEDYALLSRMARRHLPEITIVNAIHGYGVDDPGQFSPHVDVWIMHLPLLLQKQSGQIVADRLAQGLSTGMYNVATPPFPDRGLDMYLTNNRLVGWMMFRYGSDLYIHWAANRYRGTTDEYAQSIGPIPQVKQPAGHPVGSPENPGHPPGNNWYFYRGPNGLRPSMRMLAFREGLLDNTLLRMLAQRDKSRADEIVQQVARSGKSYEMGPEAFYAARLALLKALDKQD